MPPQGRKPVASPGTARAAKDNAARIQRPVKYLPIKVAPTLGKALGGELKALLDLPAHLGSAATQDHDGRHIKVVLVSVQDTAGRSRAGIPVHLLDLGGKVVDRTFTSRAGAAILRFPDPAHEAGHARDHRAEAEDTTGTLKILDGSDKGIVEPVTIPHGIQYADLSLVLDALPTLPEPVPGIEFWPPAGVGHDPLRNLPADFTPELCDAIVAKFGDESDSLLGKIGQPDDFRSKRTPLIKRTSVVRNGEETVAPGSKEPRRYLVRLRQSWVFLGYTLGELSQVDALDPGEIVEEATSTVERSVEQVSQLVEQARSMATSNLLDTLNQTNKIDTLVKAATSTEVHALAGGFGFGIPGLFGVGGVGATAGVNTSATTSTKVNTSLDVNHAISTAQTFVNEAIHSATSTLTSLARTISARVGKVSPLLSRVTNLLRWRVYENYVVCTHVEDVLELVSVPVLEIPASGMPVAGEVDEGVFSALEIAEYRRFFEPAMLDPRLRSKYGALVDGVQDSINGGKRITHVTVEANFGSSLVTGHLTVDLNGAIATLTLPPGGSRAKGVIRFPQPVPASAITGATLTLTASTQIPQHLLGFTFPDAMFAIDVSTVSIWAGAEPGMPPTHMQPLGTTLHLEGSSGSANVTITFTVPPVEFDERNDPVWLHVNQNPSYYLGVLAQAALYYPSLRDDSDKLRAIPADVWRLPIVGFEGNHIIVAKDPKVDSKDVARLLADPGAATLVQIAAPGAYSEALQGLLSLTDAEGLVHPDLLPEPAPIMPPLALVDLAGKQLVPVGSNGNGNGGLPVNP